MTEPAGTHPAALTIDELLRSCDVRRTRRGGPGGQHRNKVETAVVIRHLPTGIEGQASERRSQDLNRQAAVQRLRVELALDVRHAINDDDRPSPLWQARVRSRKLVVSADHPDFPALLAEALDWFAGCDWEAATAAEKLGVTTTQLIRFLQLAPRAIELLNQVRRQRGLRALR